MTLLVVTMATTSLAGTVGFLVGRAPRPQLVRLDPLADGLAALARLRR